MRSGSMTACREGLVGRGATRDGAPFALLAAVLAFAIGAWWNTFAAGGSDSHCYLGQARLFAHGRTSLHEPLSLDAVEMVCTDS